MSVIGILLAGGASARFPSGKLDAVITATLADQRGRPELAGVRVIDAAYASLVAAVSETLVLGQPNLSYPAVCIPDKRPLAGPAAALADLLASDRLRDHRASTRLIIVAGDAPFAPPPLLGLMAAATGSVILRADEPLPLATSLGALRAAVAVNGELPRLRDLAGALAAAILDARIVSRLDPLGTALADIDTPDDLKASTPR